jgi:hypothetical protein
MNTPATVIFLILAITSIILILSGMTLAVVVDSIGRRYKIVVLCDLDCTIDSSTLYCNGTHVKRGDEYLCGTLERPFSSVVRHSTEREAYVQSMRLESKIGSNVYFCGKCNPNQVLLHPPGWIAPVSNSGYFIAASGMILWGILRCSELITKKMKKKEVTLEDV